MSIFGGAGFSERHEVEMHMRLSGVHCMQSRIGVSALGVSALSVSPLGVSPLRVLTLGVLALRVSALRVLALGLRHFMFGVLRLASRIRTSNLDI